MDLETALDFINNILKSKLNRELRTPEIIIFRGTWQGMTYEQMANSSAYSANYLMRDIAPKFWKSLSEALEIDVGKSNIRLVIDDLYTSTQQHSSQSSRANSSRADWGNSPLLPSVFYGRNTELSMLKQWLVEDGCQLLSIWGLSGMGKSCLMKKLGQAIAPEYRVLIWRSLERKPSLTELLKDILQSGFGVSENDPDKLLPQLLQQLRAQSSVILLDGMEAILKPQAFSGSFLAGYEDYKELLRIVGESSHQSCVVFSSLEHPGKIMPASSHDSPIKDFNLSGLSEAEARDLLKAEQISQPSIQRLIAYYQGNPALLTIVAQIMHRLFGGNAADFLAHKSLVFGEIEEFLERSFARLSALETEILYWLAGEAQPMSLTEIQNGIPFSIYPAELIEALESLSQRSLIDTSRREKRVVFGLSPMMREFVTNKFLAQIGNNFSLDNRQNGISASDTIELGTIEREPTHLTQWLKGRFEPGWQPLARLFATSMRSPSRLRSVFNLRGNETIKRFKQVYLNTDPSVKILLLIAVTPEIDSAVQICVQAQPTLEVPTLPANLQLNLHDGTETVLASIESEIEDNFIQLPYFRGVAKEKFQISLKLDSVSYKEDFVI